MSPFARIRKYLVASGGALAMAVLALIQSLVANGVLDSQWWQVALAVLTAAGVYCVPNSASPTGDAPATTMGSTDGA